MDMIRTDDLRFATGGLPAETLEALQDPARDPALVLPASATRPDPEPVAEADIPSVEEIEAALATHVRGGASAEAVIRRALHPLADDVRLDLSPGQGVKRPSYEIEIDAYRLVIRRGPVRRVAEELHDLGSRLAPFAVGRRARPDDPVFRIRQQGWNRYPAHIDLKAANIDTARAAYVVIAGTMARGHPCRDGSRSRRPGPPCPGRPGHPRPRGDGVRQRAGGGRSIS